MIKRNITIIKIFCYFILTPVLIWNLSISKSIDLWRDCKNNKRELDGILSTKTNTIKDRTEEPNNGYLIDSIATDKSIEIVQYNRYITASVDKYSLVANVLVISGDYFKLMKTVNRLERSWTINSLSFQTETNYKTRQKRLKATIVSQEVLNVD